MLASGADSADSEQNLVATDFAALRATHSDQAVVDVAVSGEGPRQSSRERARNAARSRAERLRSNPDSVQVRKDAALAYLTLGELATAIEELKSVLIVDRDDVESLQWRAIAHARLGQKKESLDDTGGD